MSFLYVHQISFSRKDSTLLQMNNANKNINKMFYYQSKHQLYDFRV